jgi:SdrD B-like domain
MNIRDNVKRLIHKLILVNFLLTTSLNIFAQKPDMIQPTSKSINTELLYTGSFVWEQKVSNLFNTGNPQIPNKRFITISMTEKEITIEERITENGRDVVKRKSVLNAKTFEPIIAISETETFSYNLTFGSRIKGELENYTNGEKEKFDVPIEEKFFLGSSLEILISILPLKDGYKAFIPQVTFDQGYRTKVMRWEIEKVQELKTPSCRTGEIRDVFLVELRNTLTITEAYKIVIDKETRRILTLVYNGSSEKFYEDNLEDINPIKTKFNVDEANAMISQGTAKINGRAYTVDENKPRTIMESIKSRDKIRAPQGSIVMLIPNTPYFKEWVDFNLSIQNKFPGTIVGGQVISGCGPYPLPLEVKEQALSTEVTDNKGSFSFQSLKPGEYYLAVQFVATKYTHTTRTPNGSYNITINSDGSGSAAQNIDVIQWGSPTNVMNIKLVTVKKEGEEVKVDLN